MAQSDHPGRHGLGRADRYPLGAGVTRGMLEDGFHETLRRLRADEPVAWVPALGGWLVTSHELVSEVMRAPDRFTVEDERFSTGRVVGPSMLSTDGDRHRSHRQPFEPMFRPAPVAHAAPAVAAAADVLIDRFAAHRSAELRAELAAPLAVKVIADFLGLTSPADAPGSAIEATILGCYRTIVAAVSELTPRTEVPADAQRAVVALGEAVSERLGTTPGGPLAMLLDDSVLPPTEFRSNVAVILFGAIETSEGMTANAILHLFGESRTSDVTGVWPTGEQLAWFCRRVATESLRLEPAAAVVDRYAACSTTLGSASIAAGELVIASLAGANRDPAVFPDPDRFEIDRPNAARQLGFARGPHACLGIHLATLETSLALQRLIERLPTLQVDQESSTPPSGLIFRKPHRVVGFW